jgi:hypothetical protein
MKKCLAVIFVLVIFIETGSVMALSQSEAAVLKTWVGLSVQATNLPNIGLAPYISCDIGKNTGITYSFAAMTQEEAWISLEIDFLSGESLKFEKSEIEIRYSIGLYAAFLSQKNSEEDISAFCFGLILGIEMPVQINHIPIYFEGGVGIGISADLPPKIFIQLGIKTQLLRDLIFTL